MDAEDFKLKYRITQLSDDELLGMLEKHDEYRQQALDFAMAELTQRRISYTAPPAKPVIVKKKVSLSRVVISIIGMIGGIAFFYWRFQQMMAHPESTSFNEAFRTGVMALVLVFIIFLDLLRLAIYGRN